MKGSDMKDPVKILVTGAAGFLGYHLAKRLAARPDCQVYCVDNFIRGERDPAFAALVALPNVDLIEADLSVEAQVHALPADIDFVYHMAALNGTQNFYERPLDVIRHSTLPTLFLADYYSNSTGQHPGQHPGLKRFIYAATSEAYASTVTRFGWPVPTGEDVPLSIDDVQNPRWSYAGSKLHGEIVVAQAGLARAMPYSIIRYHNAYGPRMGDKHVIPDFMQRMNEGRYELFGHADTRSFIYVEDAVSATLGVGETAGAQGEIVNIGGTEELTMLELGERILKVCGIEASITVHPSPAGSVRRRAPDIGKLERLTGFAPSFSLDEGLAATAAFYLDGWG
jgi:UDP-glucose 4-epimerase